MAKLTGTPTVRLLVDKASLERLKENLSEALKLEAENLLNDLSGRAISLLSQLDAGIGHAYLATLWTNTKPARTPLGVSTEVYSQAEDMTFETRSNAPNSSRTYPIDGKALLSILLNGARAHPIAARDPAVPLQFPIVRGERQSRFAGTAITEIGAIGASFLNQSKPNDVLRGNSISHPGVVGNRFLQVAKERLETMVAQAAEGIGQRVSARI